MNPHQSENILIDRFLGGEMSGIELEEFRDRMDRDSHFKNNVNFQQLLRDGILLSKEDELRKKILDKINFRKPRVPFPLKLIFTFFLITGIGISLWFYVGTDSSNQVKRYLFSPFTMNGKDKKSDRKSAEAKTRVTTENSENPSGNESQATPAVKKPDHENETNDLQVTRTEEQDQASGKDSISLAIEEDKDIVVKKEKLLISVTIPVVEKPIQDGKSSSGAQNTSLAHDAAEKLNPAGGLPEEERASSNYLVEFWVSPVNYHGYKMSKSKLIIYGIEEPDAVKLYRLNDMLFMKYGNEFFRLVNTYDYLPYQRMKESEVPLAIRQ